MKTTKAKHAAARKQQRNTKRTGSDKAKRVVRKANSTATIVVTARADSKLATIIKLLRRTEGATIAQMVAATGWQKHSVRGVMSGAIGKTRGLTITSAETDGNRVYRITGGAEG
jgi:hypothetical protein